MELAEARSLRSRDIVVSTSRTRSAEYVVEDVFDDGLAIKAVEYGQYSSGFHVTSRDYFDPSEIRATGKRVSWIKKKLLDLFW